MTGQQQNKEVGGSLVSVDARDSKYLAALTAATICRSIPEPGKLVCGGGGKE